MSNFKYYNKYFGLMFRNLKENEVAVLKKFNREMLHTFFVFYPIDIVFLNDKKKVIGVKRNVKPFTLRITPNKETFYVLEYKNGKTKDIKIGQKIRL